MLRRVTSGLELADLWTKAVDELGEDDQQAFGFSKDDKRQALESLLSTINIQKDNTKKAEYVVRRSRGKPVVLREVFAKFVNCINKFKEVGDVVSQYDPTHAALPWAAVRFVIQAAMAEQQIYDSMIEGLEQVTDVITRYAWIETLYLHATSRMRSQLQDAIVRLYAAVLVFLARARRYYSKHTYQRVLKSLVQMDENAVQKYLRAISGEEEKVNKIAHLIDAQYLRGISKSMEGGFSSLLDGMGGISKQIANLQLDIKQQRVTDDERNNVLRWLDATSTYDDYLNAKNARYEETCNWILKREEVQDWLQVNDAHSSAKVLWLRGKPGTGKTILSGRIAQHLFEIPSNGFAHFFCFYGNQAKRRCNNIVKAWISQIVKQDDDACVEAVAAHKDKESNFANNYELWQLFRRINSQAKTFYYQVDGFDECEKDDANIPSHLLIDAKTRFLTQLNEAISGTGAKVLIMSRPDPEVRDQFLNSLHQANSAGPVWNDYQITVEDTADDLKRFAQSVMNIKLPNRDLEFREELAADAADKAEGMFLWIKLLHRRLSRNHSLPRLRKMITDTPSGLDQAYERDLVNILNLDIEERDRAVAILRWALYAFQPLTVRQLAEALLVEFKNDEGRDYDAEIRRKAGSNSEVYDDESNYDGNSDDDYDERSGKLFPLEEVPDFGEDDTAANDFLKVCGSLLELRSGTATKPEDMTIHFVHFSVQEYLMKSSDSSISGVSALRLSDHSFVHEKLAKVCLEYLLYDDFEQERNSTLEEFDERKMNYKLLQYTGVQWGWHAKSCRPLPESVIQLCNSLLDPLNKKWLSYSEVVGGRANGSYTRFIERFRNEYPSPLFYASLWGIVQTMHFLIDERNEDVNHVGGLYGSPLKAAAAHGFEEAVRLLLDKDADINLDGGSHGTAIQTAAACGELKIVDILLERRPDLNRRGGWENETALIASSEVGNQKLAEAIVERLIRAEADVEAQDEDGMTAMHRFTSRGACNVLKVLARHKANIDALASSGRTPLILAIGYQRENVVQCLLDLGADCNIKTDNDLSPLTFATELGMTNVSKSLIEHGADVDSRYCDGSTPLHTASSRGLLPEAQLLIKHGANINARDDAGQTPLHRAAFMRHPFLVELMLKNGADVNAVSKKGHLPLHLACRGSKSDAALRFLDLDLAKMSDYSTLQRPIPPLNPTLAKSTEPAPLDPVSEVDTLADDTEVDSISDSSSAFGAHMSAPAFKLSFHREARGLFQLLKYGSDIQARDHKGRISLDMVRTGHFDTDISPYVSSSEDEVSREDDEECD